MKKIKNYPKKNYSHAVVATDVVIFSVQESRLKVLLLKLKEPPFEHMWALPGGLVAPDETLKKSAQRNLELKAGVKADHIEQVFSFGDPDRDPYGWVVSVAYMALVPMNKVHAKTTDRYADIAWHDIDSLPPMAYDHRKIIEVSYKRLQGKLEYTNIVYSLLPHEFTLSELQDMYEIILGTTLDKRNFRKKILSLDLLKKLSKKRVGEANRPAQLYTFTSRSPQTIDIL